MTTLTRKATNVKRSVKVLSRFDGDGKNAEIEISMQRGNGRPQVDRYYIDRIENPLGAGFLVEKRGDGMDLNEEYHVLLANAQDTCCTCPGHVYHGHCKHVDALRKLESEGRL